METYTVKKLDGHTPLTAEVPGSKSITNRALLLAALSDGECTVRGALFSDDSRAFLSCLADLGFDLRVDEEAKTVRVRGTGGAVPRKNAEINVRSAGTAARFLTVMLAFAGGTMLYVICDEMIPETHSHGFERPASYALLVGFLLMLVLSVAMG